MRRERLSDPRSGSVELAREPSSPTPPAAVHHVVVSPRDLDLLDDPAAGSSPTLIRDPVDLEPLEPASVSSADAWRAWIPYLVTLLILAALVFVCA